MTDQNGGSFKPRFDATINLGHVMSLTGIVLAVVAGYLSFNSRLSIVETQLVRITQVLEMAIRQEEQLKSAIGRIDRLENGVSRR